MIYYIQLLINDINISFIADISGESVASSTEMSTHGKQTSVHLATLYIVYTYIHCQNIFCYAIMIFTF